MGTYNVSDSEGFLVSIPKYLHPRKEADHPAAPGKLRGPRPTSVFLICEVGASDRYCSQDRTA